MQDTETRINETTLELDPLDSEDEIYQIDDAPLPWWRSWRFYMFRKNFQKGVYRGAVGASWALGVWTLVALLATANNTNLQQRDRNYDFMFTVLAPAIAASLWMAGATKPE